MTETTSGQRSNGRRELLFAQCLEEHQGVVFKVARSFAPAPADLDDLVQEILLRLWSSLDGFRAEAKLSTWVYRVALNRALTWRRDRSNQQSEQELVNDPIDDHASLTVDGGDRIGALYQHIRQLREIDRALVLLSLDGLSYAEMAEVTGISTSNVGARLSRARAKLLALLEEDER